MKPKYHEIINLSSQFLNREGFLNPSIDRIAEAAGISKMTFYRYFEDKEALIKAVLKEKHNTFILELKSLIAENETAKDKLFTIFDFYQNWFARESFHGCMFTRAVVELGNTMPALKSITFDFKSGLYRLIQEILLDYFSPIKSERVAFVILMLIDGAISVSQTMDKEIREFPPAMSAWAAAKTIIAAEKGD
ncbi:TetR/AcrR family transcriptional regulator [Klebsiella quasivariicola]|uniref:TetR/AcrR family transcriptional regulator n=1 Tax=Klebsiella quasivariicola TaxID=2026240 RepID=UPI001CCF8F37|nr:TetR/AcrR family transcriptional regulator [Klebsiella quasivariicola]MBZ9581360.1 TetR/AcrR family transcriptional regulator [Klebsiella quasivariicola]